ncbi:hypothetical protein LCGC14_0583220 [marine sediment metagenome]|uniref:Uncharacterized protein n=1 Tax=marine sediment metagenome TaxID=412755 RepID=A0A0F9RZG1_9ZZZZ
MSRVYSDAARKRIDASVRQHENDRFHEFAQPGIHRTPIPIRSAITAYNTPQQNVGTGGAASIRLAIATIIGSDLALPTVSPFAKIINVTHGDGDPTTDGRTMLVEVSWSVTLERNTTPVPDGTTTMRVRLREVDDTFAVVQDPVPGCEGRISTTTVAGNNRGNTCGGGPYLLLLDPGHSLDLRVANFTGNDAYLITDQMSHFTVMERDSYPPPSTLV